MDDKQQRLLQDARDLVFDFHDPNTREILVQRVKQQGFKAIYKKRPLMFYVQLLPVYSQRFSRYYDQTLRKIPAQENYVDKLSQFLDKCYNDQNEFSRFRTIAKGGLAPLYLNQIEQADQMSEGPQKTDAFMAVINQLGQNRGSGGGGGGPAGDEKLSAEEINAELAKIEGKDIKYVEKKHFSEKEQEAKEKLEQLVQQPLPQSKPHPSGLIDIHGKPLTSPTSTTPGNLPAVKVPPQLSPTPLLNRLNLNKIKAALSLRSGFSTKLMASKILRQAGPALIGGSIGSVVGLGTAGGAAGAAVGFAGGAFFSVAAKNAIGQLAIKGGTKLAASSAAKLGAIGLGLLSGAPTGGIGTAVTIGVTVASSKTLRKVVVYCVVGVLMIFMLPSLEASSAPLIDWAKSSPQPGVSVTPGPQPTLGPPNTLAGCPIAAYNPGAGVGNVTCGSQMTPRAGCGHCGLNYTYWSACAFEGTKYGIDIGGNDGQEITLPSVSNHSVIWTYLGQDSGAQAIQKYSGIDQSTGQSYYLQFHHTQPGSGQSGQSGSIGARICIGCGERHVHVQIGNQGASPGSTSWMDAAPMFCQSR